jgi:hypothetical protein
MGDVSRGGWNCGPCQRGRRARAAAAGAPGAPDGSGRIPIAARLCRLAGALRVGVRRGATPLRQPLGAWRRPDAPHIGPLGFASAVHDSAAARSPRARWRVLAAPHALQGAPGALDEAAAMLGPH